MPDQLRWVKPEREGGSNATEYEAALREHPNPKKAEAPHSTRPGISTVGQSDSWTVRQLDSWTVRQFDSCAAVQLYSCSSCTAVQLYQLYSFTVRQLEVLLMLLAAFS